MSATDLRPSRRDLGVNSKRHSEENHNGNSKANSSSTGKNSHETGSTIKHAVKKPQTHAAAVDHIPAPLPNGGNHESSSPHRSSSSAKTGSNSLQTHATSFSPLPALQTLTVTPTVISTPTYAPSSSSSSTMPSSTKAHDSQAPSKPFKLSPLVISLISIGAACLLLVVLIAVIAKPCSRRRRRRRKTLPKPSKPIMDDEYSQTGMYDKLPESPMFGGKERYSGGTGDNMPRTWTQYFHDPPNMESYSAVAPLAQPQRTPQESQLEAPKDPSWPPMPPMPLLPPSPLRQAQDTLHSLASRLSVASMSVYRDSAYPGVGVAISSPKPQEERSQRNDKRESRAGARKSQHFESNAASSARRRSSELAYAGISSPDLSVFVPSAAAPVANGGGRTKIKSSYYLPGSYPRMSSIPSSLSTKMKTADMPSQPSMPAFPSSESRRDRETQALAAAMGFGSPSLEDNGPLSPQPTIYPDDSLSMMETRRHSRRIQKKPAPRESMAFNHHGNPSIPAMPSMHAMDTSTALGSLMMGDFGTTSKSLSAMAGRGRDEPGGLSSSESMKISNDIPPRVPSPPPLPSLAQMGLEHHNPEAYANYKSPTYSIYNYYGEDRKSRLSLQNHIT